MPDSTQNRPKRKQRMKSHQMYHPFLGQRQSQESSEKQKNMQKLRKLSKPKDIWLLPLRDSNRVEFLHTEPFQPLKMEHTGKRTKGLVSKSKLLPCSHLSAAHTKRCHQASPFDCKITSNWPAGQSLKSVVINLIPENDLRFVLRQ